VEECGTCAELSGVAAGSGVAEDVRSMLSLPWQKKAGGFGLLWGDPRNSDEMHEEENAKGKPSTLSSQRLYASARAAHVGTENRSTVETRGWCTAVGKTAVQAAAMVQVGAAWSETDPGSVTVALGRAQFSVQFFFNYSKIAQIL
jgi:hypothetical protein